MSCLSNFKHLPVIYLKMNSTTGDFSEIRKANSSYQYIRNANSSVKRNPYVTRNVHISPLNLKEILKELEEELDEVPVPALENDKLNQSNTEPDAIAETNHDDSFDLGFSVLSPIKDPAPTPIKSDLPSSSVIPQQSNNIENKFVTPNVKYVPNSRWSYQKTPVRREDSIKKCSTNFTQPTPRGQNYPTKTPNHESDKENVSCQVESVKKSHAIFTQPTPLSQKLFAKTPICEEVKQNAPCPASVDPFKHINVNGANYIVLDKLGKGGSSEVFQCYDLKTKTQRAIKCVCLANANTAADYVNEITVLRKLQNCDKIIKMFDHQIIDSEKKLYMVLEVGGVDLSKILRDLESSRRHIPMYMLVFYWMEMLLAVKQIHDHDIVHADLKPANFLRGESGLKLIDFGISRCVQADMTSVFKTNAEGSCNYISPEALKTDSSSNVNSPNYGKSKYKLSFRSDVWSLGCILYQFVYRRTPFQHITQLWPKLSAILDPNHVIDYPPADWVTPKIVNTIKSCLQHNMKSRPSVDDLIAEYEHFGC